MSGPRRNREGLSVEEAARTLRYAFLEEVRQREGFDCILTAHHADDSAETMLLNLLRGTGLRGLTGIPPVRGRIRRPLLGMTRAELARYAEAHHVPHVEDATNEKDDITRNLLRHRVMPVLRASPIPGPWRTWPERRRCWRRTRRRSMKRRRYC